MQRRISKDLKSAIIDSAPGTPHEKDFVKDAEVCGRKYYDVKRVTHDHK